jgi:hypothetical protein
MSTKIVSTNIFQTGVGVDAVDVSPDATTVAIDAGVQVLAQSADGVFSDYANTVVFNGGEIYGAGSLTLSGYGNTGEGVDLQDNATDTGGNGTVVNAAGGQIFGLEEGVGMYDRGNDVVVNNGAIIGGNDAGVNFFQGTSSELINRGFIYGGGAGVSSQVAGNDRQLR